MLNACLGCCGLRDAWWVAASAACPSRSAAWFLAVRPPGGAALLAEIAWMSPRRLPHQRRRPTHQVRRHLVRRRRGQQPVTMNPAPPPGRAQQRRPMSYSTSCFLLVPHIGAMARAVNDEKLSREILKSAANELKAQLGQSQCRSRRFRCLPSPVDHAVSSGGSSPHVPALFSSDLISRIYWARLDDHHPPTSICQTGTSCSTKAAGRRLARSPAASLYHHPYRRPVTAQPGSAGVNGRLGWWLHASNLTLRVLIKLVWIRPDPASAPRGSARAKRSRRRPTLSATPYAHTRRYPGGSILPRPYWTAEPDSPVQARP